MQHNMFTELVKKPETLKTVNIRVKEKYADMYCCHS